MMKINFKIATKEVVPELLTMMEEAPSDFLVLLELAKFGAHGC